MLNLRIALAPWNPWVVMDEENKSSVHGVTLELYDEMKRSKAFDSTYQFKAAYGGSVGTDGKWTGMIGAMLRNETDLAGPVFMNADRASVVNFAFPLDFAELVIISGLIPADKNPYLIFGIFSLKVWMLILLAVFIFASSACAIYYSLLVSPQGKKMLEVFFTYFWIFLFCLIGKDFGTNSRWFLRNIWNAPSFQILRSVWFLTALVIMNVFQGTIVSTYAANRLKPQFQTLEDFLLYPSAIVGTYEKSYPVMCLEKLANTSLSSVLERVKNNLIQMDTGVPPWLDAVEQGKSAYIADTLYSKYLIGERFKKTGKCNVRVTSFDLCSGYIALVSKRGLPQPAMRKLDLGIMRFNEAKLAERHIIKSVLYYDICTQHSVNVREPLDLMDLLGAFTMLGTGLSVSLIYFVLELAMSRGKKK